MHFLCDGLYANCWCISYKVYRLVTLISNKNRLVFFQMNLISAYFGTVSKILALDGFICN